MNPSLTNRRGFLAKAATTVASFGLPLRWISAEERATGARIKFRFAVASDLHYGQKDTPFERFTDEMIGWMHAEKADKGLDALFLNGDLVNDSPEALVTLRDRHLSRLKIPYYCGKGNHDYVDQKPGSPSESWQKIWGYPANHTIKIGEFVFVMADSSAPAKSNLYLAADQAWLRRQIEENHDAAAMFFMIHIQQRKHGTDGWPEHGVHDPMQISQAEAVMDLLESTRNACAVFHGHNHLQTGVYRSGETRYFFDSHLGGSWGAKRGYRVVEIYDDHTVLTYQMNTEQGAVLNRDKWHTGVSKRIPEGEVR